MLSILTGNPESAGISEVPFWEVAGQWAGDGQWGSNRITSCLPTFRPGPDCGFPHRRFWILTSVMQMPYDKTTKSERFSVENPEADVSSSHATQRVNMSFDATTRSGADS
jgi:hypothetical protein